MSKKKDPNEGKEQVLADPKNVYHKPACNFDYVNNKPCDCGVLVYE